MLVQRSFYAALRSLETIKFHLLHSASCGLAFVRCRQYLWPRLGSIVTTIYHWKETFIKNGRSFQWFEYIKQKLLEISRKIQSLRTGVISKVSSKELAEQKVNSYRYLKTVSWCSTQKASNFVFQAENGSARLKFNSWGCSSLPRPSLQIKVHHLVALHNRCKCFELFSCTTVRTESVLNFLEMYCNMYCRFWKFPIVKAAFTETHILRH